MARIVLISCVSKKLSHKVKARNLYISPLFKYNLKYAESLNPDKIFILSAKFGLLNLEKQIAPYEKTLNKMSTEENKRWAANVISQLRNVADLDRDKFIFLAGAKYRRHLISYIKNFEIPFEGFTIGKQLKYLKQKINRT